MREQSVVKRHPVAVYFALAFAISWIGTSVVVGPTFIAGRAIEFDDLVLMAFAMLNGPFVAGILMTGLVAGGPGLADLVARFGKVRVPARWYLPLLMFPVLLLVVAVLLGAAVSPELAPTFATFGLVAGPLAGLLEETGWMGFAYPRMGGRASVLTTAIALGIVHAIWHVAGDYLGNSMAFGGYWLPYFFGFCLHVIALRVLIVWVYTNTGSLALAMLMHASSTGFFGILISTTMEPVNWVIFYNAYGVALCLVAGAVALRYGPTLRGTPA
jgi:membrane protease YdiL (CAAX protease family)